MARGRSRGRKTDYSWSQISGQMLAVDLAEGTVALGDVAGSAAGTQTLFRTRGEILVQLDATAVDERVLIALGMMVVKENAFAAGVASVPHPGVDGEADWFWFGYASLTTAAEAAVSGAFSGLFHRVPVDSKAMRKMKGDEKVILVAEVVEAVDQGGTFDLLYGFRTLTGD